MTESSSRVLAGLAETAGVPFVRLLSPALFSALGAALEGLAGLMLVTAAQASVRLDLSLVRASSFGRIAAQVAPQATDRALFLGLLGAILAAVTAKTVAVYWSSTSAARAAHAFSSGLRRRLFARCLRFGKLYYDESGTGHVHNALVGQTYRIASQVISAHEALQALFMLSACGVVMLGISPKLTVGLLLVLPAAHYSTYAVIERIRRDSREQGECQRDMGAYVSDVLGALSLVRSSAAEAAESTRFESLNGRLDAAQLSIDVRASLVPRIQEGVFALVMLTLFFALAFFVDGDRDAFVPALFVFVYLARRAYLSVASFGRFRTALAGIEGAVVQVRSLLDDSDKRYVPDGVKPFPGLRRAIRFQGLSFSFPGGRRALEEVSFSAEKGRMTAVVGETGAGKTTLMNLLLRFYDAPPGTIFLDDDDVRSLDRASLMRKVAFVSQDCLLLDGTLRENLTYGLAVEPSQEEMGDALDRACLTDFVAALPSGLQTRVGERGVKLSGGEKQRLAIARALLRGAEILLLDEATSALDAPTEAAVRKSLESVVRGRTSLVVAHRLSTIRGADKIVVVEDGRSVEEGTLVELLAKAGPFRRYWDAQSFGSSEASADA